MLRALISCGRAWIKMSCGNPACRNFGFPQMKFPQIPALQEREREQEWIEKERFPPEMLRDSRI
jgi:hypothetical protein